MIDNLEYVLNDYGEKIKELLGSNLVGIYLTGSIALGGYHDGKSDIDFTVVMRQHLNENQIPTLKAIHKKILKRYPKNILEGHYITVDELGKLKNEIRLVVSYYQGNLSNSYHGISIVTWFTLKKYGVTACGLPSKNLSFDASLDVLLSYVINNVNSYWVKWLSGTERPFSIRGLYALTSASIEWGVLGISRMYYTLAEKDVASKDKIIAYILGHAPIRFHKILNEALRIRTENKSKEYSSVFKRRHDMIEYIGYMIDECNKLAPMIGSKSNQ